MKNTKAFWILLALLFVGSISVLSMTACNRGGGSFTLTGIPSEYNGKYAYFYGLLNTSNGAVWGYLDSSNGRKLLQINGGSVSIPLRIFDIDRNSRQFGRLVIPYRGRETLIVSIFIFDQETISGEPNDEGNVWMTAAQFNSVSFSNGNARRAWSAADQVKDWEEK